MGAVTRSHRILGSIFALSSAAQHFALLGNLLLWNIIRKGKGKSCLPMPTKPMES
jgi:hypothetical protein